jgi:hypothetical protein
MSDTRKRGSIAKVTYFPEGCIDLKWLPCSTRKICKISGPNACQRPQVEWSRRIYIVKKSSRRSGVAQPAEAPHQIFRWAPIFYKKKRWRAGGGRKFFRTIFLKKRLKNIFPTMTSKKMSNIFPLPCLLKKGVQISQFHQFRPAFGGHSLQIFLPSITEVQANFPNVLSKMLW